MSSSTLKQWTKYECSNLIELYRAHSHLWDAKSVDYKNKIKKQNSLKEMSEVFGTSCDEVDRKIKNLISQFHRERRNYKNQKKAGTGKSFASKWYGYDAMRFLHKKKSKNAKQSSLNLDNRNIGILSNENPSITAEIDIQSTSTSNVNLETQETSEKPPDKPSQVAPLKKEHSFIVPETGKKSKSTKRSREVKKEKSTRDVYEVFGELVVQKLRSLETTYAKAKVQHLINNILFNAELGQYNEPTPSSSESAKKSTTVVMLKTHSVAGY